LRELVHVTEFVGADLRVRPPVATHRNGRKDRDRVP
jgi:hypothetical protein